MMVEVRAFITLSACSMDTWQVPTLSWPPPPYSSVASSKLVYTYAVSGFPVYVHLKGFAQSSL